MCLMVWGDTAAIGYASRRVLLLIFRSNISLNAECNEYAVFEWMIQWFPKQANSKDQIENTYLYLMRQDWSFQ